TLGYTRRPKPGALGRSGPGCEPPDSMSRMRGLLWPMLRQLVAGRTRKPDARLPELVSRRPMPGAGARMPEQPWPTYLPRPGTLLDGRWPGLAGYLRYAARSCVR